MLSRIRHLRTLEIILDMFASEVSFGRTTMPECCLKISFSVPEPYKECLRGIFEEAEGDSGRDFMEVFAQRSRAALNKLPMEDSDLENFLLFTGHGGLQDREMQLRLLKESRERIGQTVLLQEKEFARKGGLVTGLGVLGGLLLSVILV